MIRLVAATFTFVACAAWAGAPDSASPAVDTKRILVLSPQGVGPAEDTVGFNTLVRNVTQSFSESFQEQVAAKGIRTVNVLDQKPGLDVGQKLALYAGRNAAEKVAVLTVETAPVGNDVQLQLRVQFVTGHLTGSPSEPPGLRVDNTVEKSYCLRGTGCDDKNVTMQDLARDFVNFLSSAGQLD